MDCSKAWNLMMKSFDQESSEEMEEQLEGHLALCDGCRIQYEALVHALAEMRAFNDFAPEDMEMRVMQKLGAMKKEVKTLLPYVTAPLLMFSLTLMGCGVYQAMTKGLFALVDPIIKALTIAYRTSQAVSVVIHRLFNTFYVKQAVGALLILVLAYGIYSMAGYYRKARNRFIWRISK